MVEVAPDHVTQYVNNEIRDLVATSRDHQTCPDLVVMDRPVEQILPQTQANLQPALLVKQSRFQSKAAECSSHRFHQGR